MSINIVQVAHTAFCDVEVRQTQACRVSGSENGDCRTPMDDRSVSPKVFRREFFTISLMKIGPELFIFARNELLLRE